ncbi:alpha-glucosidase [Maribacter vaceletii]|uniref:Alpha-glucosidase n=1 Tax=Maribacter vaceletii TaxID=1206816 RepID=A0A495EBY8_9FLAO|nr:glycoside hydrolase family 97 protein [Maribacter vaceletii]RKR14336.1 alpha-glucosidase [Maribacter vaceletii]
MKLSKINFNTITFKQIANILSIVCILISVVSCSTKKEQLIITNGAVKVDIITLDNNQLAYTITKENQIVLDTSLLGIVVNNRSLGSNSEIIKKEASTISTSFPLLGIKEKAIYNANQTNFTLKEEDGFTWNIEFNVSSEGVAYRYIVPGEGHQTVNTEITSFKLPNKTKVWYFERDSDWKLKSHAGEWLSTDISAMPTVSKMGPIQGLTLTCELPNGGYALIAESALFNYSGLRLKAIGNNTFKANFTEEETGFVVENQVTSAWRCILLADDLNALANNTMVAALNPAPDPSIFTNTSWIKPGKSVWHWWSGKYVNYKEEREMVEDAEALNFEYSMVDEGWERWDNKWKSVKELCDFAKTKDVGIFLWKHSKEINFPENDYAVMRHFLDSVKQVGAVGVKVDFMNGQSKSLIAFDEALLKNTAKRQLMVNFHGCQQSSGEYRTYPNEVTREGIRGLEVNHMKEGPLPASHNAALPFTRYVTGHADYTPIGFTEPGETTWAHQLGTLVAFYSPFNCIAENTQFLLKNESVQPAINFIKEVPSVWDETLVLPESKIGELAAIARRDKQDWYVGVLHAREQEKLIIDCSFLEEGDYTATIFTDDIGAKRINLEGLNKEANLRQWNTAVPFKKETQVVHKNSKIEITLAPKGGAAIQFKRN